MRSRSSTTPHLPSYFLLITSIQLFHHQSYRHTFPVPNEPSKAKVHQIPSHPAKICIIELPHFFSLLQCSMVLPSSFSFVQFVAMPYRSYFVPYVAILSRPLFILILPPILFRHFQKFSKLLHPLRLHLPSIKSFSIGLDPVEIFTSLLFIMLRRIPMVTLQEPHHLIVPNHPLFFLCHCKTSTSILYQIF